MWRLHFDVLPGWLPLVLCFSFLHPFANSEDIGPQPTSILLSTNTLDSTTQTIDIAAALAVAASVAPTLALGNLSNPIPLPTDAPNYNETSQLGAAFPPLQQFIGKPSIENVTEFPAYISDQVGKRQGAIRVMAVGDSMTHCMEGDFTWRYRLWEWSLSQNFAMDFVGPYEGTVQPKQPAPPVPPPLYGSSAPGESVRVSGKYAVSFDSSHFAISGRAAAVVQGQIQAVSASYPTDVMLVMLGFNDLGWFYSDDDGLIRSMKSLIANARLSNPRTKFVIGTVPHRTFIGGRQDLVLNTDSYNRMLRAQGPGWSTPTSPVVIAPIREEYDCGPQYGDGCPAAWDGLHPNELGEYQIARAFSRALVGGLGIGREAIVVPTNVPLRYLPIPGNLQMGPSPQGLTATWDKVFGAYGYDIDYIINGGAPFNFSPGSTSTNRWDTRWALEGWTYQIRVRASSGNRKSGWTEWVSGVAKPQTASAPNNVVSRATATGLTITWTPPTGAYSDSVFLYNVYYWDLDLPCSFLLSAAFVGSSASINGLVLGHRYLVITFLTRSVL
ncbi:hypothetical protein ONS96_013487 [Cadophora gregata f. sp. sojae]|nr:hypothetical protein ONS96_013487 [Cadophora gregata f. sp. sojae]